ncbi:putative plasma membrane stress response protein [Aureobasidium sp. EXF-3400]|nr:putative plasma membrane stress response protein [Aureobasidium sp. EXF-12344]KAI4783333.1 putative plasma membrane stress response protein [Aureobasidium sp. EXF-3400]
MQVITTRSTSNQAEKEKDEDFEIDWVLLYDFEHLEIHHATDQYHTLIRDIEAFGLEAEVRHGHGATLLTLIRIPRNKLGNEVYRSRVKDWLFGIVHVRPLGDSSTIVDAATPSEEIRSVFHLVTWTKEQGGAGVTANFGQWKHITASFAPHAWTANKKLLKQLSAKIILGADDLDSIKALFGEKVAFYYAFIQAYSLFLIVPAISGTLFCLFSRPYSIMFGTITCVWSIETDLSIRWHVQGVGALKVNRVQYNWEKEDTDAITGEVKKIFPAHKRLTRQLLFLPFAALAAFVLSIVLVVTFLIEAIISDVYGEELANYWAVHYLPTILLAVSLPYITDFLTSIATRLSEHENHRTNDEFELAQVQKAFVLNFVTSFLPLVLTAYIYVPFGSKLLPYFVPNSWQSHIVGKDFNIDAHRLQEEVISLSLAGQLINFGEEFVLPFLKRHLLEAYRRYQDAKQGKSLHQRMHSEYTKTLLVDAPHEEGLLSRLGAEAAAPPYDVQEDIMEMCVQFGYLAMFGVIYPLMPLGFLINNWIELRGDFFKLISESQRPPPIRSDSIGPCISALEFLTWLGSLSTAALLYMYSGDGDVTSFRLDGLLLTVFIAEQAYLATKLTIRFMFDKIGSEAVRAEEASRRLVRKRYLETFSEEFAGASVRQEPRTYTSQHKRPSSVISTDAEKQGVLPVIHEIEETVQVRSEYKTEQAERFWNQRKEFMGTAEAGVRLIVAIKGMQANRSEDSGDKSKWI